jgi:hypothetical protein
MMKAVGRPQIPHAAFEQALATSIRRSQIFSKVVDDQTEAEDFILVVTLFSIDKRLFGHTVRLEADWTLERADTKALGESRSSPSLTDPMCSSQPVAPQRTT